jgi:hypothetical protein
LVEEIFPVYATPQELERFQAQARHEVSGWLGFFRPFAWPVKRLAEGRDQDSPPAAATLWLAEGGERDPDTIGPSRVRTR